jgi:hypothetical protein
MQEPQLEQTKKGQGRFELMARTLHHKRGYHLSPEAIRHIADARIGKHYPAMSEAKKGERNPNWKGNNVNVKSGRDRAERKYPCPKGTERHHVDGNPLNNLSENVLFVTRREHMILDGRIERRDAFGRFI